jgi:peptidoglycan/LPS O-acetylase OafA/YrhL
LNVSEAVTTPEVVGSPTSESVPDLSASAIGAHSIRQANEERSRRVESVRALAAIGVVEYHTMLLAIVGRHRYSQLDVTVARWGIAPIYIFFALSGYLIFRPFARRDYGAGGRVNLAHYSLNRVVRLLPIYYVAVTLLLLVRTHTGLGGDWWRFFVFAQAYSVHTATKLDAPLWTLVVELQFYLVLPFLAFAVARVSRRSALKAALILICIGAASLAYHASARNEATHLIAHLSFPANFVFIVVGMIIAVIETQWAALPLHRIPVVLRSSGTWLIAGVALWPLAHRGADSVALLASFLIVGSVILPLGSSPLVELLDWRPLATLGIATYSLYIWHFPLIQGLVSLRVLRFSFFLDAAIAIAICGAAALLSYRFIEAPFLRLRRRWAVGTVEAQVAAAHASR